MLLLSWLLLLPLTPSPAADDAWVGQDVFPKRGIPEISRTNEQGEVIVLGKIDYFPVPVREEKGDWVKVQVRDVAGWVAKSKVVRVRDGIQYFTERIQSKDDLAEAYQKRAWLWSMKNEPDIAIQDATEALRLDPKDVYAYMNRGIAWSAKKDYDKAIADYNEALRLDPKDALAYNNRGWTYYLCREYDQAMADYDQCLKLDPQNAYATGNRGLVYAAQKKYPEAVAAFEAAVKLPEYVPYEYAEFLASCPEVKYRDGKRAVELAKKAIELKGKDASADVFAALAAAYAETGDFEQAVVEQRTAIDKLKENKYTTAEEMKQAEARLKLYEEKKPYRQEK
ncbi:MAG TPA: tetratricopeptide repeat protein [Gemmatales bacterium]|nr:tetratricopeptide repeat protein [Gemmatales bacterium]